MARARALGYRLALRLDRAEMMRALGLPPDRWQADLLRADARRILVLAHRQCGKSTVIAALVLWVALFVPGSLIIIASPSQRQSSLLFRKVLQAYRRLRPLIGLPDGKIPDGFATASAVKLQRKKEDPLDVQQESALRLELKNGSWIVSLPDNPDAVVGYSGPALIVIDEAARVSKELYLAVRPMLAVSRGRLVAITTPKGKRGWFFEQWSAETGTWLKVFRPIFEPHPRISSEDLEEERQQGRLYYAQEYECRFLEDNEQEFSEAEIEGAFVGDFSRFKTTPSMWKAW